MMHATKSKSGYLDTAEVSSYDELFLSSGRRNNHNSLRVVINATIQAAHRKCPLNKFCKSELQTPLNSSV